MGASLTVGFEREINIPFVGKVASFSSSVTQDFMSRSGVSTERETVRAFGSDFSFEDALGIVVYNVVGNSCYYYDVFSPDSPADTSRAMSCQLSSEGPRDTLVTTLEAWHALATKQSAGWSWVDVGHRAPGGALTNDLAEPGNYPAALPVDEFLLLFRFPQQTILPTGVAEHLPADAAEETWYASEATGCARTHFTEMETNTTLSVGAGAGGVTVETSATFGRGWENSSTVSWSRETMFAGGYSWADSGHPGFYVVPYVYQATARTEAGTTYPYWVMDYYVPGLYP
jgi:hypothetical protein